MFDFNLKLRWIWIVQHLLANVIIKHLTDGVNSQEFYFHLELLSLIDIARYHFFECISLLCCHLLHCLKYFSRLFLELDQIHLYLLISNIPYRELRFETSKSIIFVEFEALKDSLYRRFLSWIEGELNIWLFLFYNWLFTDFWILEILLFLLLFSLY